MEGRGSRGVAVYGAGYRVTKGVLPVGSTVTPFLFQVAHSLELF